MINPCSFCEATCCKTYVITVTTFDILRIAEHTRQKPESFAVLHPLKTLNYDPDTVLDTTDGVGSYLLGLKSHPCTFLGKDNQCTIHEFAPLSCQRYPYTFSNKMNTRFCPLPSQLFFKLKGPDISNSPLIKELNNYKLVVKEWNKKPGKMHDCLSFLLQETAKFI